MILGLEKTTFNEALMTLSGSILSWKSFILAIIIFPIFRALLGPVWVEAFFGFFVVGYLAYDYIHYYVHHFIPKNRVGRYLKQNHMIHHFAADHARWGVSSPLWDFVFRTYNAGKRAEEQARQHG